MRVLKKSSDLLAVFTYLRLVKVGNLVGMVDRRLELVYSVHNSNVYVHNLKQTGSFCKHEFEIKSLRINRIFLEWVSSSTSPMRIFSSSQYQPDRTVEIRANSSS